jgi:hypothetical protein
MVRALSDAPSQAQKYSLIRSLLTLIRSVFEINQISYDAALGQKFSKVLSLLIFYRTRPRALTLLYRHHGSTNLICIITLRLIVPTTFSVSVTLQASRVHESIWHAS